MGARTSCRMRGGPLISSPVTTMRTIKRCLFAMVWAVAGLGSTVWAQSSQPINGRQFLHQSWTIGEGAPPGITALAQAPDGYLWMGAVTGLYRFDGAKFTRFVPDAGHFTSNFITALKFTRDGALWMGSYNGGAAFLKDGKFKTYSTRDNFPPGWVLCFAEGPDGDIWAATGQGLGYFDGAHWHIVGKDWDYPADRADWLLFDAKGTLWVSAVNQLVFLRRGSKHFEKTNVAVAPGAMLATDAHDTLWVTDRLHGVRPLRGISADHPYVPDMEFLPVTDNPSAARLMFDHAGEMWASNLGTGGVFHVAHPDQIALGQRVENKDISDVFTAPRDLTSNNAVPVIQDREGDIWIGTHLGIDSYRPSRIGTLPDFHVDPHAHISVSEGPQGHVWISKRGAVYRVDDDQMTLVVGNLPDIWSLLVTTDGTVWIIGRHDLYRWTSNVLKKIALPNHLFANRFKFIAADSHGVLWASIDGLGIFSFENDKWNRWIAKTPNLQLNPSAGAIDADGSKWFGYAGNELLHVDSAGNEFHYTQADGVTIGMITAISLGKAVLFAGDAGLARFHNGHIQSITDADEPLLTGITGMAQLDNGDVWINSGRGVVQFTAAELDKAFSSPGYQPQYTLYDSKDGVEGISLQGQPVSTMQVDRKGRVWFGTSEVIQWIDAATHFHNPIAPPVYVRDVFVSGKDYQAKDYLQLPNGTDSLQIDYTALSLSLPDLVRFKYKLVGIDKDWQDADTRRRAYYTNLSPGQYRFQVTAANEDGVWNDKGASIVIDIPPLFYQTRWFQVLIAVLFTLILAVLFVIKMRRVEKTTRLQSEARHAERERIARDLHDTLLQAVHALMLRFESLAASIPENSPLQDGVNSTIDVANTFIVDGRNRVKALRSTFASTTALGNAITQLAKGLEKSSGIRIDIHDRAAYEEISPVFSDDLFSMVRESLINALHHAQATLITITIADKKRDLILKVADNGKGISAEVLNNLGDTGHWGIIGMKERAIHMGAKIQIDSSAQGTHVTIQIPLRKIRCHRK